MLIVYLVWIHRALFNLTVGGGVSLQRLVRGAVLWSFPFFLSVFSTTGSGCVSDLDGIFLSVFQ